MNCTNCNAAGVEIHEIYYPDENKQEFVCITCAGELGFCIGCGYFMAGSEFDENSGIPHVCADCVSQAKDEDDDFFEWDYEFLP